MTLYLLLYSFFYISLYTVLDCKSRSVQDVVNSTNLFAVHKRQCTNPQTLTCPEAAALVPALTPTHVQSPAAFGGIFSFCLVSIVVCGTLLVCFFNIF